MKKLATLTLLLALVVCPAYAQNLAGTLGFDLVPGSPTFGAGTVTDADSDTDTALTVNNNDTFSTLVRLDGASDLMGVSFDFAFDETVIEVVSQGIRETRADIDFSSQESFNELTAIVTWFAAAAGTQEGPIVSTFDYTYNDGSGGGDITTQPGVVLDVDGDLNWGFNELTSYVGEFADNAGGLDVPFWTEVLAQTPNRTGAPVNGFQFNESVEVFDRVAAGKNTYEDNTAVMLARPNDGRDGTGAIVPGYGFDGNAIILEVTFQAVGVGSTDITISNAVGIDETFQTLADVKNVGSVVSTVTVQ